MYLCWPTSTVSPLSLIPSFVFMYPPSFLPTGQDSIIHWCLFAGDCYSDICFSSLPGTWLQCWLACLQCLLTTVVSVLRNHSVCHWHYICLHSWSLTCWSHGSHSPGVWKVAPLISGMYMRVCITVKKGHRWHLSELQSECSHTEHASWASAKTLLLKHVLPMADIHS